MITVEILAVITTLLCVWFLNKKKTSGWWWSILAAGLYGILFMNTELYFQAGLQGVFILSMLKTVC